MGSGGRVRDAVGVGGERRLSLVYCGDRGRRKLRRRRPIAGTGTDVVWALASGAFLAAGSIAFYAALTRGSLAVVSAIAALYFVVPVFVGVFVTPR